MTANLLLGDSRQIMAALAPASIDAIVTDPPYDLTAGKRGGSGEASVNLDSPAGRARISTGGFMGKAWDATGVAFDVETWAAALRVLKPGAHLVAFGAPRTYHRLACAIEDAGFEVRDCLMYMFGSGFPKSLDVSKALDKAAGAEREPDEYTGANNLNTVYGDGMGGGVTQRRGAPSTDLARRYDGWGTALKPAYEPIILARKPLIGTVAANVQQYGTGALNIDATRIGTGGGTAKDAGPGQGAVFGIGDGRGGPFGQKVPGRGRWPANVLLDEEAARLLDAMSGETADGHSPASREPSFYQGGLNGQDGLTERRFDSGGASRFFYTAKASRVEREFGLDDVETARRHDSESRADDAPGSNNPRLRVNTRRNDHPTVKPVGLMAWLCRLVTPPGGLILDPFVGSGSTGMAALDEGFRFIGIDLEPRYLAIARRRIARRHLLQPLPQRAAGQALLF